MSGFTQQAIAQLIGDPRFLRFNVLIREDAKGLPFLLMLMQRQPFLNYLKTLSGGPTELEPWPFSWENKSGDHNTTHAGKICLFNIFLCIPHPTLVRAHLLKTLQSLPIVLKCCQEFSRDYLLKLFPGPHLLFLGLWALGEYGDPSSLYVRPAWSSDISRVSLEVAHPTLVE